jgi:hypothetical protein
MKTIFAFLAVFICCLVLLLIIAPVLSGANDRTYTRAAVYRYQELRMKAEEGDLSQTASALKEVLAFWPPTISHENSMAGVVAASRDSTVREILTRMRSLSGEDLGADPEAWLKKYYQPGRAEPNQAGGANGRQPISSETNSTSGAAASRR